MYKRSNQGWIKHLDFILLDVLSLQLAFIVAYNIRIGMSLPYSSYIYGSLSVALTVIDIFISIIFNTMHNVLNRGYYQEAIQTLKQCFLVLVTITFYMFTMQIGDVYSRLTIAFTAVFHFVFGYLLRLGWKMIVPRIWKNANKAAMILVADEKHVPEVFEHVRATDKAEYVGIVLTNRDGTGECVQGLPVVADLRTAADYICREWVDEVLIYPNQLSDIESRQSQKWENIEDALDGKNRGFIPPERPTDQNAVAALIEDCRQMAIPVHVRLPISDVGRKTFVESVGGYTVLTSTINYASPLQLAAKRIVDIMGGLVGSLIALVVILIVGPQIKKESPGPILFKQTRIGLNGRRFQIYKIRSMYLDAEERKAELMGQNRVSDGMMFKLDWDPRIIGNKVVDGQKVTGIGEKIRKGSWDEWPQFFNILLGQMSLVGTRPPTLDEWEKYKYHHRARLAIKPGLTGMWQVSGRSRITDFEEVVRLDTEYINNWSMGLDVRILLKTIKTVSLKEGAM